jgi:alkanesulfonate monooxygenase SsuD/methylene tetrahydromethanopterin reductase-like flavin-dependent oxidoreductase (luciferase family)
VTEDDPPHVGLFLPQMRMTPATIEERVVEAESCGYHSVWFMDHLAPPAAPGHDSFEAWTTATWVAARTATIRVGHLVLCDAFRHPVLLAEMAATLDVLSDGRLELGLGWGSVPDELERYGFGDPGSAARAGRLRETLEILGHMFEGEPFDYDGSYFQLHDAIGRPTPVQPHVPIHLGGSGPKLTLPLVRDFADWWNCPTYAADDLDELRGDFAARKRISVQRPVGLAASSSDRDEVVATAERRFGAWGGLIAGTPEEVAAALRHDIERGVELVIVQFTDFGEPETIRRFADEVIPTLRA